jgi:type II secretory pathway component PulF
MTIHFQVYAKFHGTYMDRPYFVNDISAARHAALDDGANPILRIKEVKQNWLTQEQFSGKYGLLLLRAIKFQVEAGVAPAKAIQTAIEFETNARIRAQLQPALDVLNRGGQIADAIYATGLFDTTVRSIVAAGEIVNGTEALKAAFEYMEDKRSSLKSTFAAASILSTELFTALTVPPTIQWQAIPWIMKNLPKAAPDKLEEYNATLSTIGFYNMIWMIFTAVVLVLFIVSVTAWMTSPKAKSWLTNKVLAYTPLLGKWYQNDAMSRSFKSFSKMLRSGVRLNEAMKTILVSTSNPINKKFWGRALQSLSNGVTHAQAFGSSGILRKDEILVIEAASSMEQLAHSFKVMGEEREWQRRILGAKILRMSIFLTIGYILVSLLIALGLFDLFNKGLEMTMNSMTQGF